MLTIHKFPFEIADFVDIAIREHAEILKFDNQNETPIIWALVNTDNKSIITRFMILGTGFPFPENINARYIGFAQFDHGRLVWHLYNLYKPRESR